MTTKTFTGPDDQTAAVAAGFTSGSFFDGRLYEDGLPIDASAVIVTLSPDDVKVFTVSGLTEKLGSEYVIALTVSGDREVEYYPRGSASHQTQRVIPVQTDGESIGSLGAKLFKDNGEITGLLTLFPHATGDDNVVTGFPPETAENSGGWGFSSVVGAVVLSNDQWTIDSSAVIPAAGSRPAYSLDIDLEIFGALENGRLGDLLQDEDNGLATIARARCQADQRIDLRIGSCYPVPLKADLAGTWTVTAGSQAVAGTGTLAEEELEAGQMITLGDEDHEILARTSDTAIALRDPHLGGAVGVVGVATPRAFDSLVRWWSYIWTIHQLLPGATAGSESLKMAVDDVEKSIASICDGRTSLPGLVRSDTTIGFGFERLSDHLPDPRGDLLALLQHGRHHRTTSELGV